VADLRDVAGELCRHLARHPLTLLHAVLEARVCRSAAGLATVSSALKDRLVRRGAGGPVGVVCNGYEPSDFVPEVEPSADRFVVVHCGSIIRGRSPAMFLDALDLALRSEPEKARRLDARFYGTAQKELDRFLRGRPCAGQVRAMGSVPFTSSIAAEQQATVLLVLGFFGLKGVPTSKVYEYVGARRPILAAPGDGDAIDALLDETGAGRSAGTPHEAARVLLEWLDEWEKKDRLAWRGDEQAAAQYTRYNQTARLAELLDKAAAGQ
jgi:glycosyltransferase involved in cell wall biosynthesis